MFLEPQDIASYIYCPMLYYRHGQNKINPKLTEYETFLKKAFILGEEKALLRDTAVSVSHLTSAWDSIYWPTVINKIEMKAAEKTTYKAVQKFTEYCKYEIADYLRPTIGTDVKSEININGHLFKTSADIIKTDLESKNKNTVIVSFSNRELTSRDAAFNNIIRTNAYGFYSDRKETITCINVNINENNKEISLNQSTFKPNDMAQIRRTLEFIIKGIKSNVKYMNSYCCEDCNLCPKLK